jgi:poly-gamma-glutamate synthesis protein (capsule biosynthesis protein)
MIFGGDIAPLRAEPMGMFGNLVPVIQQADLALANLEIALSKRGRPIRGKPIAHTGPPEAIEGLREAGFDAFNLANNHILDFGEEPLLDTLETLHAAGLGMFGAGRNAAAAAAPYVTERKGIKIGLLGYTPTLPQGFEAGVNSPGVNPLRVRTAYRPLRNLDEYPGTEPIIDTWPVEDDLRRMCEDVASLRKRVNILLVYQHWGSSITERVHEFQKVIGRTAIDCGADAVFGGHQHLISAIEFYREKPIIYGMGNLLFDIKAPFLTEITHRTFLFGARMAKKLKLPESRVVIPSRLSLAARRRLRFFLDDKWCPSWIGGQKGDARCDVNCDDWTDPPLREATTLECYRRSHKIALAELDAANRACPTRRLKTKTAPRFSPGAA